jgi:hypothetical protein
MRDSWCQKRKPQGRNQASTVNLAALAFVVWPELALRNLRLEKVQCRVRRALIGAEDRALLD